MTTCLPFKDWDLEGFEKGRGHKKYNAILINSKTDKVRKIPFGDNRYEHFKDSTGEGVWSHLDHNDKKRRDNYRKRHKGDNLDCFSPGYFSWCYLW